MSQEYLLPITGERNSPSYDISPPSKTLESKNKPRDVTISRVYDKTLNDSSQHQYQEIKKKFDLLYHQLVAKDSSR